MQQQELAQIRHREANLTALAAIGPRKKRKTDSPGAEVRGGWEGGIHVLDVFLRYNEGKAVGLGALEGAVYLCLPIIHSRVSGVIPSPL